MLLEKRAKLKRLVKEEKCEYLRAGKKFSDLLAGIKRQMRVHSMAELGRPEPVRNMNESILDTLRSKQVKDVEIKFSFYEHSGDNDLRRLLD